MLSTGEIRKVLLAATLSQSPRVLVLDKPFDGLDAPSRYVRKWKLFGLSGWDSDQ
jgi:ABC-type Mn2+/Zn2+ transport system ATPase subunit